MASFCYRLDHIEASIMTTLEWFYLFGIETWTIRDVRSVSRRQLRLFNFFFDFLSELKSSVQFQRDEFCVCMFFFSKYRKWFTNLVPFVLFIFTHFFLSNKNQVHNFKCKSFDLVLWARCDFVHTSWMQTWSGAF